jgi:hypothetical protein
MHAGENVSDRFFLVLYSGTPAALMFESLLAWVRFRVLRFPDGWDGRQGRGVGTDVPQVECHVVLYLKVYLLYLDLLIFSDLLCSFEMRNRKFGVVGCLFIELWCRGSDLTVVDQPYTFLFTFRSMVVGLYCDQYQGITFPPTPL